MNEPLNLDSFEFVKLKIPTLIPRELIEHVKGKTFSVEQFYEYQKGQLTNPHNFLYALIDQHKKIHGYLWAEQNLLDNSLFVNTFSIQKKFWGKGLAVKKAIAFLSDLKQKVNALRVFWCTTNEKFYKRHGFKRSKICLMEYNENKPEVIGGSVKNGL